jgi:integrase
MAWLEQHPTSKNYHLCFRFGGKKYRRTLDTDNTKSAEATRLRFEENLVLLERGRFELPPNADLITFLLSDGKLAAPPVMATSPLLGDVFDRYLATCGNGSMEPSSLEMLVLHLKQIRKKFGESFKLHDLATSHLQDYVNTRVRIKGNKSVPLSTVTLQKEMAAFRACFNWAVQTGILEGKFPNKGLRYPKGEDKRPFMTWADIERRIGRGGLAANEIKKWWDCLFLDLNQISEFVAFMKSHGSKSWMYPMVAAAGHTGARRSELLRLHIDDIDFQGKTILIHERKRVKGQKTTRRVPLTPFLEEVLKEWIEKGQTGGQSLFSDFEEGKPLPLTVDDAGWQFVLSVRGTKWSVLRGWHVLRHSFVSNLAAKGVDQRFIDEFVGHSTEAQRRRYRHLFPHQQREVLCGVFGMRINTVDCPNV